ncbi:acyltransferase [Vreelandella aquamarina]|uniref:Chloramphenicol acetyltransferase n=1 Tax=Vreelandella aquamarina TaxID=77097 RepID=A0A6F8SXG7_9GAMM|nr:acyltransferase [Halomonas meridiana]BCA93124.1 transferase [Halomonas meridiana]
MAYLSHNELNALGLEEFGDNVLISDKASIYNPSKIRIGSNVRIDDFCILSAGKGGIIIENYIHIAAYASLIGAEKITLSEFSNLSSRVSIYSSNDDYSGEFLTNPMVPDECKNVTSKEVNIGKHVIIGSGSVVLPGVTLEEGVAIGALSLVTTSCEAYGIYAGQPAKKIKERKKCLKKLEENLKRSAG